MSPSTWKWASGAEFDRLDQVVIDIGVEPGLAEGVERRAGGAAAR